MSDLDKCPCCGGLADNGYDRCVPPSPYFCIKCTNTAIKNAGANVAMSLDDEIEQLKYDIEKLTQTNSDLLAENEQMREALTKIARVAQGHSDKVVCLAVIQSCKDTADEALKQ